MKQLIWLSVFLLYNSLLVAQEKEGWTAFWNSDTTLIGFKDATGEAVLPPRFMGLTTANKLEHIMAAMEPTPEGFESYYLTKALKIVGRDSLYFWDNAADCESEGFIRFQARENDQVGLLNRNGEVAIPAEYNMLTRVMNGMIVALKGAKKQYDKHEKHSGCMHYRWEGGQTYLIDTANNILVTDFSPDHHLDFFSIAKVDKPYEDSIRACFRGLDGQYYTFVDYEKEFSTWLFSGLLDSFTQEQLTAVTHEEMTYWDKRTGWMTESGENFSQRNYMFIKSILEGLSNTTTQYDVFIEKLNPFIFTSEAFEQYFNNCLEAKDWQYPVMNLVISYNEQGDFYQNHFEFLRTEKGYKMIGATIRNGK